MHLRKVLGLAAACLLAAGCASRNPRGTVVAPPGPPEPYVRLMRETNRVDLQVALREFRKARGRGPSVWLVGVSHLGETNYFEAVQAQLDRRTLVLYEGVGGGRPEAPAGAGDAPDTPAAAAARKAELSGLQGTLADALGLRFQLDAIDYTRPNFRNSDLTVDDLRELLAESEKNSAASPAASNGPAGSTIEGPSAAENFEGLLGMMQGEGWMSGFIKMGAGFLRSSPKFQAMGKLALVTVVGEIQGDPARLRGLPPALNELLNVLIQRRNARVMTDLSAAVGELSRRDSVAVFYGTGHMPDLEEKLRSELHYLPATNLWLNAMTVDFDRTGLTAAEADLVYTMVRRQMEQMQKEGLKGVGPAPALGDGGAK